MSDYQYPPGTRPLSDVPGGNEVRWDHLLNLLEAPAIGHAPVIVRLTPGTTTAAFHYIKFRSKKDGQLKYLFTLCPNFDLEAQDFTDGNCPVCRNFNNAEFEQLYFPQGLRYYVHAFHISKILEGATSNIYGIIPLNGFDIKELDKVALMHGKPVDHPQNGCCVLWARTSSNNKKRKHETAFAKDRPLETRWFKDQGIWAVKIRDKVYRGEPQNLLRIIPKPSAVELEKKLHDLGLYNELKRVQGMSASAPPRQPAPTSDWNTPAPAPAPSRQAPPADDWGQPPPASQPAPARQAPADDWGQPPARQPAPTAAAPDDDWGVSSPAPAPAPQDDPDLSWDTGTATQPESGSALEQPAPGNTATDDDWGTADFNAPASYGGDDDWG